MLVLITSKTFRGGLAWIKYPKKDMAVTFSYSAGMRLFRSYSARALAHSTAICFTSGQLQRWARGK